MLPHLIVGSSTCARTWHRARNATAAAPRRGTRPWWASPTPRWSPARGSPRDVLRGDWPPARRETPVAARSAWPRYRPSRRDSRGGSRPPDSCRFPVSPRCALPAEWKGANRARQLGTYSRSEEGIRVPSAGQCIIETKPPPDGPMQARSEMSGPCDDECEVATESAHQEQAFHVPHGTVVPRRRGPTHAGLFGSNRDLRNVVSLRLDGVVEIAGAQADANTCQCVGRAGVRVLGALDQTDILQPPPRSLRVTRQLPSHARHHCREWVIPAAICCSLR